MKTTLLLTALWPAPSDLLSPQPTPRPRSETFALPGATGFLRHARPAEAPRERLCPRCERDRSLSRWWRAEWAAEERRAKPLGWASWGLMLAAGALAILAASRNGFGLVENFPAFTAWAARILGGN